MIALSTAPATALVRRPYYDLQATIALLRQLHQAGVVDGFEFQNLAEWDAANPPRNEAESRLEAWHNSPKYAVAEIGARLRETGLPILSLHANRDVGICLCSGKRQDVQRGRQLMEEALWLAGEVGATVCVFHLWDTWKESYDPGLLRATVAEIAPRFPGVKMAVENVPTHLTGFTPLQLAREFDWITLDLKWAALYDELDGFAALKERLANVHLRGHLAGSKWVLPGAPFRFYDALDLIRNEWGYSGLLTMEPDGLRQAQGGADFTMAMASLRPPEGN